MRPPLRPRGEQVRGPDRHRRGARRRRRPGRPAVAVAAGPRSRTTPAARPRPRPRWRLITKLEELLDLTVPHGELAEEARAWEHGVDELAESDERGRRVRPEPRAGPGHRRPARGQRRRHRPGVRALPAPARRRAPSPEAPRPRRRAGSEPGRADGGEPQRRTPSSASTVRDDQPGRAEVVAAAVQALAGPPVDRRQGARGVEVVGHALAHPRRPSPRRPARR